MDERAASRERFLVAAGWADAERQPLTGDASPRRYWRLTGAGASAILMDAAPGRGQDVATFLRAGAHFASLGLSVPECVAADTGLGFLLLEDLGRRTFAELVAAEPGREEPLYRAATEALLHLHAHEPPAWAATYGPREMAQAIRPAWDWYLHPGPSPASAGWAEAEARLARLLSVTDLAPPVLLHRDFHAENLIWLPDRPGPARVGMLDFQDALAGSRAYDLASLLQDARRDVPPSLEAAMIGLYAERAGIEPEAFARAYAAQAVQRQLRILGIFARLARRDSKTGYLSLLPRVWEALSRTLRHPDLAPLGEPLLPCLKAPDEAFQPARVRQ